MPSSPAQKERRRTPRHAKKFSFHISAYRAGAGDESRGGGSALHGYTTDIGPRGVGFVLARGQKGILELLRGTGPLRLVFDGPDGGIEVHAALAHSGRRDEPGGEIAAGARLMAVSDTDGFRRLVGAPDDPRPSHACLDELFDAQAEATPDGIAVTAEGESLSFRQLAARANALASLLRSRGVCPGTLVGVFVERSPEMLVGLLAVLKAGGAYVPLDPTLPRERLAFIIEDTQMPIVLAQENLSGALPGRSGAKMVLLDGSHGDDPTEGRKVAGGETRGGSPGDLAYVIYTSGSTGRPKGVMVTHGSVANYVAWMDEAFPMTAGHVVLQKAPFTFDASVWEIYLPLLTGARLVLARHGGEQDSGYIADLIAREGVTDAQFVPSLLRPFLETPGVERCLSLRRVFSGGEALPAALRNRFFERLPHVPLYNLYGPTETTVYSAYDFCRPADGAAAPVHIGRPIRETRLHLLDRALTPVGGSQPGEIYIGGEGLARGYLNRPGLTAERFVPDPFSAEPGARLYRTGDVARATPDGSVEYLGRADHQVKVRGVRVELGEIEAALGLHRNVRESVVVARESASGDKKLVAYVVPNAGPAPSVSELRAHLGSSLPNYMMPSAFVALAELPLTHNGKVDLRALPAPAGGRSGLAEPLLAPRDDAEQGLRLIWEEVLGVSPIGVRDDFFELGGDSLSATHMLAVVGERFGRTPSPSVLMRAATIEGLARRLTAPAEEHDSLLVAFRTGGTRPPLFFVHGLGGEVYDYRALAPHLGADRPVYALRAQGLTDSLPPHETVEEMAAAYVKEVLAVRPRGPYFLGGYSSGGTIAYEMAGQLWAAGHEVAYLAVLDEAAPPGGGQDATALTKALRFARNLPYWLIDFVWRRTPGEVTADVKRRVKFSAKKAFGLTFRLAGLMPPEVGVADELTLSEMPDQRLKFLEVQYRALKAYRPHLRPLPVTLYRTRAQSLFGPQLFDKGWGRLGCQVVNVRVVHGNHKNLCEEPHARHLAAALREDMEAAPAPPRGQLLSEGE
jgi:amino acid adenylation domain-containing protein